MKKALLVGVAALLLAGCSQTTPTVTPEPATGQSDVMESALSGEVLMIAPWTISLLEQNDSNQTGTATLIEKDGKVIVTLNVDSPSAVAQPAHIHVGSCPMPGAVEFPLTDVSGGESVTTIDTTISALKDMGALAINVHKSAAESKVYTSCGDLK